MRIPSTTVEYVRVPVRVDGVAPDPGLTVELAIVAEDTEEPGSGDWKTAAWDDGSARLLVGPGTQVVLTNGRYDVWVRVTSSPELVVRKAGTLEIT